VNEICLPRRMGEVQALSEGRGHRFQGGGHVPREESSCVLNAVGGGRVGDTTITKEGVWRKAVGEG